MESKPSEALREDAFPENDSVEEDTERSEHDTNLAAYTPPGSTYPPYISINYRNTMVEITVRSPEGEDRSCGSLAKITMNLFHFQKLIDEARNSLP